MFESKPKDVKLWACGNACVAYLRGRQVVWYRTPDERTKWRVEADLPRGMDDVVAIGATEFGVSVVAADGRFTFFDAMRREWRPISDALRDGSAP